MTKYIKYSERHSIKDQFLAKLADYIERVIGWDIDSVHTSDTYTSINAGNKHIIYTNDKQL